MNRRYVLITIVVFSLGCAGLFAFLRDTRHKARDLSAASVCMANMRYVKQQLFEHAAQMPADTPIAAAIEKLAEAGVIDPSRLVCGCSGRQFAFRGIVGWLQNGTGENGSEIIAFEPVSSHHRSVRLEVLLAHGRTKLLQRDELQRALDAEP